MRKRDDVEKLLRFVFCGLFYKIWKHSGSCPDREIEGKCNKNIKAHGFTIQTEANFVCVSMFISSLHGLQHNFVCLIGVATLLAQHPPSKLHLAE